MVVAMGYRRFENRTARFVALVTVKDRVGFGVSVAFVTGRIIRRLSAFWNDYFEGTETLIIAALLSSAAASAASPVTFEATVVTLR